MKVVLDTNVLVSGTFWTGDSFRIIRKIDLKDIMLILSKELLDEYDETIRSEEILEKIENKNLIMNKIIKRVIEDALIISPETKFDIIKEDPDDNRILECAFEGKADYIITQDGHLLKLGEFEGIKIIMPDGFLKVLDILEKV